MNLNPETVLQINLMAWLNFKYPDVAEDTIHIANQRACSIQQGKLLKRMGVKAGVPDLFIAVPRNGFYGLWLELKEGKGKPSKSQQDFILRMNTRGYMALTAIGLDAAKSIIEAYLENSAS